MKVRHHEDKRIVYLGNEPYFNSKYKLSGKQVRKIVYGRWKDKSDECIIYKIKRSEKMNNTRIGYHLISKEVLRDESNYRNILVIRLAVTEDIISGLRRNKSKIRGELKSCDDKKKLELCQ